MINQYVQQGLTLLELAVVLLILTALGGLAVPYVMGTGEKAMCQTTDATLQAVRDAIMGGKSGAGFYGDLLGQFPHDKGVPNGYTLHYLITRDDGLDNDGDTNLPSTDGKTNVDTEDEWPAYNPKTGVGWHGPYLNAGSYLDTVTANHLDTSFSQVLNITATPPIGKVHVALNVSTLTQIGDGWGRPIVLQVPYYDDDGAGPHPKAYHPEYARLVSAGPGNGPLPGAAAIDTDLSTWDASDRGDDRVLFLKNADPKTGGNTACD